MSAGTEPVEFGPAMYEITLTSTGDNEANALAVCVKALSLLADDESGRVATYLSSRFREPPF